MHPDLKESLPREVLEELMEEGAAALGSRFATSDTERCSKNACSTLEKFCGIRAP